MTTGHNAIRLDLRGPAGADGADAAQPVFTAGTITTLAAGSPATATVTGGPVTWALNLGVPKGADGVTPTFTIGTITTLNAGLPATATITGTAPNYVLNLGLPRGADASVPDASSSSAGIVVLAGDLQGSYDFPVVPPATPGIGVLRSSTFADAFSVTYDGRTYKSLVSTAPNYRAGWQLDGHSYYGGVIIHLDAHTLFRLRAGHDDNNNQGLRYGQRFTITVISEGSYNFNTMPDIGLSYTIGTPVTVYDLVWTGAEGGGWSLVGDSTPGLWTVPASGVLANTAGLRGRGVVYNGCATNAAQVTAYGNELAYLPSTSAASAALDTGGYKVWINASTDTVTALRPTPGGVWAPPFADLNLVYAGLTNAPNIFADVASWNTANVDAITNPASSGSSGPFTIVHECMHALDFVKGNAHGGGRISAYDPAFNTVYLSASNNATGRDTYAYTNLLEFFAEAMACVYYYKQTGNGTALDFVFGKDTQGKADQATWLGLVNTYGLY